MLTDGSEPRPDEPPTIVDITVLASGDLRAEYENGDWFRFDAAAGMGRSLSTFDDGSQFPLEMNRPAYQHTYTSVLGHDPLQMLGELVEYYSDADNIAITARRSRRSTRSRCDSKTTATGRNASWSISVRG